MAVPSSGNSISLAGLAAEKDVDDYNDADYDDVLSLKDITIGGNANGNSFSVDPTNGLSSSHPNNTAPFAMSEFYSYDHDAVAPACNMAYHNGGQGTFNYPITLGSDTGIVTIEYQAFSVPDKFVFTWNGNTYTSGSGNGTGDGFVGAANQLSALQATDGNSSATITTLTTNYGTGSQNTQSGGRGTITFNKNSSVSSSNMRVEAPLGGTAWWFSVSCPGMQVIGGGSGVSPSVVTNTESSVGQNGFTMNGTVNSKGLASNFSTTGTITHRGFVTKTGAITDDFIAGESGVGIQVADNTNSTGTFNKAISALVAGTTYTYRAYATNAAGTTYGANEQVTTLPASTAPGIVSLSATSVSSSGMTMNGNMTSTGNATVTDKGFVYSSNDSTPTIGEFGVTKVTPHPSTFNTTGSYSRAVTGLSSNTTFYYRAYATNSVGTSYGSTITQQTQTAFVTRYISGPFSKNFFACFTTMNTVVRFTGTFGNGTQVYDNNLNLMNSTNGGNKWYGGPPASSSGATSAGFFFVNSSGVVSNFSPLGC